MQRNNWVAAPFVLVAIFLIGTFSLPCSADEKLETTASGFSASVRQASLTLIF